MDNIRTIHQYGNIAMQKWQNSAVRAATLPTGVELTSCLHGMVYPDMSFFISSISLSSMILSAFIMSLMIRAIAVLCSLVIFMIPILGSFYRIYQKLATKIQLFSEIIRIFNKKNIHKACGNMNVPEIDAICDTLYYNEKGTQQGLSLWKYGVTLHQIILHARNNMNSLFPS